MSYQEVRTTVVLLLLDHEETAFHTRDRDKEAQECTLCIVIWRIQLVQYLWVDREPTGDISHIRRVLLHELSI